MSHISMDREGKIQLPARGVIRLCMRNKNKYVFAATAGSQKEPQAN